MDEELIDGSLMQTISDDGNLLDATQNAIMDAAENVSGVLSGTGEVAEELHSAPFYNDVEFWLAMAFVLAVIVIAKPLFKILKSGLQNRIQKVIDDFDEATKLRDDAQNLLVEYERKFVNTDKEVAVIVENSRKNLQNMRDSELKKLKNFQYFFNPHPL